MNILVTYIHSIMFVNKHSNHKKMLLRWLVEKKLSVVWFLIMVSTLGDVVLWYNMDFVKSD